VRPVLESSSYSYGQNKTYYYIGNKFSQPIDTGVELEGYSDHGTERVCSSYTKDIREVTWMNRPEEQTKSVQVAYLLNVSLSPICWSLLANETLEQYGNLSEIEFEYSFCCLLFLVPAYAERTKVSRP
jgi:hypothetical protein